VNDGVLRVVGVECDVLTGVGAVRSRDLKPFAARGTGDQQHFAVREAVKALEEVDAAQRDPLPDATVATGEDDFREEPTKRVQGQGPIARAGLVGLRGWPAARKSCSIRL